MICAKIRPDIVLQEAQMLILVIYSEQNEYLNGIVDSKYERIVI